MFLLCARDQRSKQASLQMRHQRQLLKQRRKKSDFSFLYYALKQQTQLVSFQFESAIKASLFLKPIFFKKMGQPWPLFRLFLVFFKQTIHFFTTNQCEKCPNVHPVYGAGIRTHNLLIMSRHPLPLDKGSRPLFFLSPLQCYSLVQVYSHAAGRLFCVELLFFFKKMGQYRPLFVYFRSFLVTISIEKSIDGVLGIRTRGRKMVGADETTELWRPPCRIIVTFDVSLYSIAYKQCDQIGRFIGLWATF